MLDLDGGYDNGPLFNQPITQAPKPRMQSTHRDKVVRSRIPAWADRAKVAAVFRMARYLTQNSWTRYSVDHIVPINHPLVCGFHVEHNLCVKNLDENIRKSNRTWPDMPDEQMELFE